MQTQLTPPAPQPLSPKVQGVGVDVSAIAAGTPILDDDEPLKQEVFDKLCSGWTAAKISRDLLRSRGIALRPYAIKQFFDNIPASYILPPTHIRQKLMQLDIQVDAVGEMQRLLRITEERLATALLVEDLAPDSNSTASIDGSKSKSPKGITVEGTRMTTIYWQMLKDFVEIQQELGDLPKEPITLDILALAGADGVLGPGGAPRTLRDILTAAASNSGNDGNSDNGHNGHNGNSETEPTGSIEPADTDYIEGDYRVAPEPASSVDTSIEA